MNAISMKSTVLFLVAVCLFSVIIVPLHAMEAERQVERTIVSQVLEQQRAFTVVLPTTYATHPQQKYPVLYLLDGENNLSYTQTVSDYLAENALMPELIIVAIPAGATRSQDYLPSNDSGNGAPSGRSQEFRKFLSEELMPLITKDYRTAPLRLLSGHSLGGLFVLDTLAEEPRLFQRYLVQSPYLVQPIASDLLGRIGKRVKQKFDTDVYVHVVVGNEPELAAGIQELEQLLEKGSSALLHWKLARDEQKTHMTTRLTGQYAALEFAFSDWSIPLQTVLTGKAKAMQNHIASLSEKYGYPVLYSMQLLAQAAQTLLSQQDFASAQELAQLYVSQYPDAVFAHFVLANSALRNDQLKLAKAATDKAIKLYQANPDPELSPVYAGLLQMKKQLNQN